MLQDHTQFCKIIHNYCKITHNCVIAIARSSTGSIPFPPSLHLSRVIGRECKNF